MSPFKKIAINFCVMFLITPFIFFGCNKETDVQRANREQKLMVGMGPSDPESLDPHIYIGLSESRIGYALYEGLMTMHPETCEPLPAAAERYTISADVKTYTFYIRKNARWSNGDPLLAKDFVYGFKRLLTPSLGSSHASSYYVISGAEAYHKGRTSNFDTVAVKALADDVLEIKLDKPVGHFLSYLCHHGSYPLHQATVEKYGDIGSRSNSWSKPEHFVGNGPFVLKSWRLLDKIVLVRNPHYWNDANIKLKTIEFYPYSIDAEENAYRVGKLHRTENVRLDTMLKYKQANVPDLKLVPFFLYNFFYAQYSETAAQRCPGQKSIKLSFAKRDDYRSRPAAQ